MPQNKFSAMKTNIATTREQSDRLLKCGVSAESADMCYDSGALSLMDYHSALCEKDSRRESYEVVPAFSLGCLLEMMPKEIEIDGYPYRISIYFENPDEPVIGNQWCLYYKPKKHNEKSGIDDVPMYAPDLIECAVQMIIWLKNYGYNLNGIEEGGDNE